MAAAPCPVEQTRLSVAAPVLAAKAAKCELQWFEFSHRYDFASVPSEASECAVQGSLSCTPRMLHSKVPT